MGINLWIDFVPRLVGTCTLKVYKNGLIDHINLSEKRGLKGSVLYISLLNQVSELKGRIRGMFLC